MKTATVAWGWGKEMGWKEKGSFARKFDREKAQTTTSESDRGRRVEARKTFQLN